MSPDSMEARLDELERKCEILEEKVTTQCDRHLTQFVTFADLTKKLVDAQGNSLGIPVLRDVLIPLVMKLFAFFTALVFTILAGILGIKEISSSMFH